MTSIIRVQCQGEPREMGLAQGLAKREEIRRAYDALRDIEAFRG